MKTKSDSRTAVRSMRLFDLFIYSTAYWVSVERSHGYLACREPETSEPLRRIACRHSRGSEMGMANHATYLLADSIQFALNYLKPSQMWWTDRLIVAPLLRSLLSIVSRSKPSPTDRVLRVRRYAQCTDQPDNKSPSEYLCGCGQCSCGIARRECGSSSYSWIQSYSLSNVGGQRPLESGTPDASASEVPDGMGFSGTHCSDLFFAKKAYQKGIDIFLFTVVFLIQFLTIRPILAQIISVFCPLL
jgi:hypothetical protein